MSTKQLARCFRQCPLASTLKAPQPSFLFYFLYEYNARLDFEKRFPGAVQVGIGCLEGWVWHINAKGICSLPFKLRSRLTGTGKPNVRKMFYNGSKFAPTDTFNVTYGWVYRISKEDEARLHDQLSIDRVRTGKCIRVKHPRFPGAIAVPVIFYWDIRNTCDGWNFERWNSSEEEQGKWQKGVELLKGAGAPAWYTDHIMNTARGTTSTTPDCSHEPHNHTLYANLNDLTYTHPTNFRIPPPLFPGRNQRLKTMIGRAEQRIARLQTTPLGAHSTSGPQSTYRPRSAPRPQSAPQQLATPPHSSSPLSYAQPTHQRPSTPTPTGPGPNVKTVKKRKLDTCDDGGQLMKKPMKKKLPPGPTDNRGQPPKKPMKKKLPPGPSNLRHGTPV